MFIPHVFVLPKLCIAKNAAPSTSILPSYYSVSIVLIKEQYAMSEAEIYLFTLFIYT
jgi:hypothetical protein